MKFLIFCFTITILFYDIYSSEDDDHMLDSIINVENDFIQRVFSVITDCNSYKEFLQMSYETASYQAYNKLLNVFIKLVTKSSTETFNIYNASESIMKSPNFNISKKNVIFIHGFTDRWDRERNMKFAHNIISSDSVNMMMLDGRSMIGENYLTSTTNVIYLGQTFGHVLADMHYRGALNFHLIGHSLGAHISGMTGKTYKKLTGSLIKRISGLDPAGPCYFNETSENRLSKSDAEFVDIIHTNSNILGLAKPIGHIDFYPNNGLKMPGCIVPGCDHGRCLLFISESVKNNDFLAVKCANYDSFMNGSCSANPKAKMGYWLSSKVSPGNYYLRTAVSPPFALGKHGLISFNY